MTKKQNIALLTVAVLLTLGVAFLVLYTKNKSEFERASLISFQKSCSCCWRLEVIGEQIERYQKQNAGRNPPSLDVLRPVTQAELIRDTTSWGAGKYQGGECSYVYRGDDLDANAPGEMILAYDRFDNHRYPRHVLFAKPKISFHLRGNKVTKDYLGSNKVTKAEYDEFCKRMLRAYDPNISIKVEGWKSLCGFASTSVDASLYSQEEYVMISEAILKDYNSGNIRISVYERDKVRGGWWGIATVQEERVRGFGEEYFRSAIRTDNQLRQEYGLPQKPIVD